MKTIAVIFGGRSTEHDVSIITALAAVIKPLELTKQYKVEAVYISKDGNWFWDDRLKDVKTYQNGLIDKITQSGSQASISLKDGLTLVKARSAGRKQTTKIDVVFPATHGTHGEDGELMGLLQMARVPFVGCDMQSSVIAMDKVLSKQVTTNLKLPTTPWMWFNSIDLEVDSKRIHAEISKFNYPLFVKPAHLGSSIGITKVNKPEELHNALEVAVHYDDKVIVEEGVANLIEVTLPIMGNDDPVPALLEQPLAQDVEFFDFDQKYIRDGGGKKSGGKSGTKGAQGYSQIPAEIGDELTVRATKLGLDCYKAVGCSGTARVDMLIDSKTKEVFFNEINPLPGSLYSHNWNKAGVSSVELVSRLVDYAEQKFIDKQKYTTVFDTNFLAQF